MPEDLFGTVKVNVDRFRVVSVPRKKKSGSTFRRNVEPPPRREWTEAEKTTQARIERRWQGDYLAWAFQELKRWKDRLPADEYAKQYARLRAQRAAYLEPPE